MYTYLTHSIVHTIVTTIAAAPESTAEAKEGGATLSNADFRSMLLGGKK